MTRARKNRKRRVGAGGRSNTANPDFGAMLHPGKNRSLKDIYGTQSRQEGIEIGGEEFVLGEEKVFKPEPVFPGEIKDIFRRMSEHFETLRTKKAIITEESDVEIELTDEDDKIIEGVLSFTEEDNVQMKSLKETFDPQGDGEIDIEDIVELDLE